ncbi:MAG: dihydropteroate synthase [Candidatus Azotimanducaceae bacterium]|jgi:dihydropteroate synthase
MSNTVSGYDPKIMGIINVTPDSFSDGGEFLDVQKAIAHGIQLHADGADVLDVGGESTRPGAIPISSDEELSRVIPVIEGLRKELSVPISIDTRNASVMQEAVKAGASMINDVTALTHDEQSLNVAVTTKVPVFLMHMQGTPETMQENPQYEDVVTEVYAYLEDRIQACVDAGIEKDDIYCDVGIGFGKTLEHNIMLLQNLSKFKELGTKLLLGTSRKGFIPKICGDVPADKRIGGSLASIVSGLEAKVDMFRVHDVHATKQFIEVYTRIKSDEESSAQV